MRDDWKEWINGKEKHKELSDAAAPIYDAKYASANFSTGSYMDYEIKFLRKAIKMAPDNKIALDLGCGTGRSAFLIARHFEQVRGYDFSEKMIVEAEKKKLAHGHGGVAFGIRDLEEELLEEPNNSISFINAGFGMGSFVFDIHSFLREMRRLLKPKGILVISFYNSESLIVKLKDLLLWDPSLAAKYDIKTKRLEVNFENLNYHVSDRAYTYKEIKKILVGSFIVEEIVTYPTLSSLLPNEIFRSEDAQKLCKTVDMILAQNEEIAGGPYILAICKKGGELVETFEPTGYERILYLFRLHKIRFKTKEHTPIHTLEELESALNTSRSNIAKSVLFVHEKGKEKRFYAVILTADRKVHLGKLARTLNVNANEIRMATQQEVEELIGFHILNLPPFGFPKFVTIIIDVSLDGHDEVWCGLGKKTEHVKLKLSDLKILTSCFNLFDVSKIIVKGEEVE